MRNSEIRRRGLSLLLALVLLLGLTPAVSFSADAAYYDDAVAKLLSWGVLRGYPDGTFRPDNPITRAEFVAMVNRAYGYNRTGYPPFQDVAPQAWYADDISIAYNAGYFNGTSATTASPEANLTREQAMVLLAKNMRLDAIPGEVSDFADSRSFSDWSRGYVKAAVNKGLIQGYADGTFRPKNTITRGEMAVLLARALGNLVNSDGSHSLGSVYGNVTLNTPGTVLRDTTIAGDLYIAGGMGLGGSTLNNVRVLGKVVVVGGGESESGDSVILRNTQADGLLVDSIADQYVSVRADGDTVVDNVMIRSDTYIMDRTQSGQGLLNIILDSDDPAARFSLAGNLENVTNKTPGSELRISTGSVQNLTIDEEAVGSRLIIDSNATARTLDLDTAVAVTGAGDVDNLYVNTAGVSTEMLPDAIEIRPGVTANIAGETMDTALGRESSLEPRLLAGYPKTGNLAATSALATFSVNKSGTVYWAVSRVTDGSIDDEALMNPAYSTNIVGSGNLRAAASGTEYSANVTKLESGAAYYLSAMLVDSRGAKSPVKVYSFTTPDNSVPAFASGYPTMSRITDISAQVLVMSTKSCDLYFALLPSGSSAPTVNELRSAAVTGAFGYGVVAVERNQPELFYVNNIRDLTEMDKYDLYLWLNDADNSKSSAIKKLTFQTVDRTPPVFLTIPTVTSFAGNNIRLNTVLNEAGTVYWVAVTNDTVYPKVNANNVLTEEWARVQIENGSNAGATGKSGKVTVKANTDATINITGLTPETQYKIYYMAKDTAGNYSTITIQEKYIEGQTVFEVQEYVIQGTLDNTPPTATQEFTRYSGTDSSRPYADTDVRIVFREDVLWTKAPAGETYAGGRLLALYQNASATGAGESAKEAFRNALSSAIKLYDVTGVNAANPPLVTERTSDIQAGTWTIDYRNAIVELENGRLIVTFPNGSALNLNSGSSYYFQIEDIADTSSARNLMGVTKLNTFTTISAQVALEDLNLTNLSYTPSGGAARTVEVDVAFTLTPVSTTTVDSAIDWDLLLWSDASIDYQLYRRKAMENGVTNTNPWTLLPGTGHVAFTSDYTGKFLGQSLNQHFTTDTTSSNHPLYQLADKWEYAVHITKLNESENRRAWSQSVTFQLSVVSGGFRALQTLATNITESTYASALAGATPWSAASKLEDISTPTRFQLVAPFTDTTPPEFADGYPLFSVGDSGAQLTLMLDRPGTIYYVVAPFAVSDTAISTTINTRKQDGTALTVTTTGYGSSLKYLAEGVPTTGIDNSIVTDPSLRESPFYLSQPTPSAIYNPRYTNSSIKTGSISVGDGAVPITVSDLEPETHYFVYFVLKGTGQIYSDFVQLYQFETTEVDRPVLELSGGRPNVTIRSRDKEGNDAAANVSYQLVTYNLGNMDSSLTARFETVVPSERVEELKRYLVRYGVIAGSDIAYDGSGNIDYANCTIPSSFNSLLAMATPYTEVGSYYSKGSVFDEFATQSAKDAMGEYIRSRTPTGGAIVKTGTVTLPVTRNRVQSYTTDVDCSKEMSNNMWYVFLAVGRNPNGSGDAFSALYPVQQMDSEAPKVTVATLSGAFDPAAGKFINGGNLIIQFDEPIYYKQQDTQGVSQTIRPVAAVGINTAAAVHGVDPAPISVNSVSTITGSFSLVEPTDSGELYNASRTACQTLNYSFTSAIVNNDTITFMSQLCDAGGMTRTGAPLSIRVSIVKDSKTGEYTASVVIPSGWDARTD